MISKLSAEPVRDVVIFVGQLIIDEVIMIVFRHRQGVKPGSLADFYVRLLLLQKPRSNTVM